jgi:hypothetical protein
MNTAAKPAWAAVPAAKTAHRYRNA